MIFPSEATVQPSTWGNPYKPLAFNTSLESGDGTRVGDTTTTTGDVTIFGVVMNKVSGINRIYRRKSQRLLGAAMNINEMSSVFRQIKTHSAAAQKETARRESEEEREREGRGGELCTSCGNFSNCCQHTTRINQPEKRQAEGCDCVYVYVVFPYLPFSPSPSLSLVSAR